MNKLNKFLFSGLTISLCAFSAIVDATVYYVDPSSGNDSNPGMSQSQAWRTIPGTRTSSDSGFLRSSWGSITSGNKIAAGDIIYLKGGTSHTSANGGRVIFDSNYYSNGTSSSRIEVLVSPTWGNGDFTIDGSGITVPTYLSLVYAKVSYLTLSGVDASKRLAIKDGNVSNGYNLLVYGSSGTHTTGVLLEYLDVSNGTLGNIGVGYSDNGIIRNSIIHDSDQSGIQLGLASDVSNDGWLLEDLDIYDNGLTTTGTANLPHGVQIVGSSNVTVRRVKSHGNRRDGFDFGTAVAGNTGDMSGLVIDSASYNNGEDGFGVNGGPGTVTVNYINVVAFNNGVAGWQIYDNPDVGIYQSVAHSNGNQSSFGGNILTYTDPGFDPPNIILRNNVFYKPKAFAQIGSYTSTGGLPKIDSDYNIYVPRSSDTEVGFDFPFGTRSNYNSPPAFIGQNDKLGMAFDPGFVAANSTTTFTSNNYRLDSTTSPAIDAGVVLAGVSGAERDMDQQPRNTPPEIGLYEYGSSSNPSKPSAPINLRVVP